MAAIIQALAAVLIPVLAGFLAKEVLKFTNAVNTWPPVVQSILAVVIAAGVSALEQHFPSLVLPSSLGGFNQDAITAFLLAVVQLLFPVQAAFARARVAKGLSA